MRAKAGIPCCSSSFRAPLVRSPATTPLATNARTTTPTHAGTTSSSPHSFSTSHRIGDLGERKKHVLQFLARKRAFALRSQRGQFGHGALAAHAASAEQHEAIAEASRVADLMHREEERAPVGRMITQGGGNLARLPQVESLEGLIDEQGR